MLRFGAPGGSRRVAILGGLGVLLGVLLGAVVAGGLAPTRAAAPGSADLVISQVYGGGGNSGALYTNDFVELFNPTDQPVTFADWSVQYAAAGGSTWDVSVLTGTHVLAPGQYFLVQEARGAGGSQPLPTPDSAGSINLNATAGKVALVRGATALACGSVCHADPQVADFMGYGPSANDYEGSGPAPAPGNPSSALRGGEGCTDTDDNAADFAVADPPLPRNSATPPHLCSGGPSPTATATPTPRVTPAVEIAMLYAFGLTTATPQPDEAVRLANVSAAPVAVGGWQVRVESGAAITLPLTATLAPGVQIWIADTATGFRTFFGRNPDYEYGGDTDPAVPQATADRGFTFADLGGAAQLYDSASALQDTLVYGTGDPGTAGWIGLAAGYYRPPNQPAFRSAGQIFYRKIAEASGLPVADTDTKDDWAQDDDPAGTATPVPGDRENDDALGKKLLHPGWPLTDPDAADLAAPHVYTETNVTTEFLVEPDNGYLPIHNLLVSATQSITIETYEWHAAPLVQDVIAAHARGVQVSVILDGNPCCTQRPDDETLWSAQQWEASGIPVYFFSGTPATGEDTYRYDNTHAKILVVDGRWVVTGADNFALSALTTDPRGNGTAGERGALILTDAPDVVAATLRLIAFDFAPGRFADVVRYPALGTPPPGYSPTPFPDMTGYMPVKPTPLVVTETEQIALVQAPETGLRDLDGLIGLVDRAGPGDTVLVEQQYERTYWENSPSDGPNPRLAAYIRAAQRGATVRILLDGFFEGGDCGSSTHNPATVAYVNGLGLPNLQARVAAPTAGYPAGAATSPTTGNIHNKMVLVTVGGAGYVNVSSINGSVESNKLNREYGLQIQSNAGYLYYQDVFDYDWAQGYLPCGAGTPTGTPTDTPPSATATLAPSATPSPPPSPTASPTVSPTPSPAATPVPSATTTPLPATPLPATPTPTACAIAFSDVRSSDYFYAPVLHLACAGVISGYADGTFRPYSTTTRAQQVKIVVLAYGLPLVTPPAGGATFADVPPAFPFFAVVEAGAHAGLVSGYACGGPGEPCDAQQRPYFRPYAYVTRGQLAKIAVLGAGWTVQDPPVGTFADVAPGSAFYAFVETAACHGIISGYDCGGPGEPCDALGRPYFRQYRTATRGQIAKIVDTALRAPPGCAAPGP